MSSILESSRVELSTTFSANHYSTIAEVRESRPFSQAARLSISTVAAKPVIQTDAKPPKQPLPHLPLPRKKSLTQLQFCAGAGGGNEHARQTTKTLVNESTW